MMLFKARAAARKEFDAACDSHGLSAAEVRLHLAKDRSFMSPFFWPAHEATSTAADMVHAVAPYVKDPLHGVKKVGQRLASLFRPTAAQAH
jgi:uncharacterized protein Usg